MKIISPSSLGPVLYYQPSWGVSISAGLSSWPSQSICCKSLKICRQMPAVKSPCTCPNVTCGHIRLSTAPSLLWLSQLAPLSCDGDNLLLSLIQSIPASGQQMAHDIVYCFFFQPFKLENERVCTIKCWFLICKENCCSAQIYNIMTS